MNPQHPVFDQNIGSITPAAEALPAGADKHVNGDETQSKYDDILSDEDSNPNKLCTTHDTVSDSAVNTRILQQQAGQKSNSGVKIKELLVKKSMEAEIVRMANRQDQLEKMVEEFMKPKPRQVKWCKEHSWGSHGTHECYRLNANLRRAPKFEFPVNARAQHLNRNRNNCNGFHDRSVNINIPRTK